MNLDSTWIPIVLSALSVVGFFLIWHGHRLQVRGYEKELIRISYKNNQLREDLDYQLKTLKLTNASLRGQITKLKNKAKKEQQ